MSQGSRDQRSININRLLQNYDRELEAVRARIEAMNSNFLVNQDSRHGSRPIYQMVTSATGDPEPVIIHGQRYISEDLQNSIQDNRRNLPIIQPIRIRGEDWNEPSRFPRLHPTHRPSITPETRQYLEMLKKREKIPEMDDIFNRLNS